MISDAVSGWRHGIRFRIDGQQWHYDGIGDHSQLHATAFQYSEDGKRYWKVGIMAEIDEGVPESYTFGDNKPLTLRMAKEIATRFVTGRKIPKTLEWR